MIFDLMMVGLVLAAVAAAIGYACGCRQLMEDDRQAPK